MRFAQTITADSLTSPSDTEEYNESLKKSLKD